MGLPPALQEQIQNCALELAKSVGYTSVGTMEFLVDLEAQKFYFIEMNTRLQVEHPVTEMVLGVDLVKEQIRIAAGEELSYRQQDLKPSGHVIEVRINAEDPRTLIPSPGLVASYHPAGGNGVRVDSALYSGYTVQPYYDSLVSKLIVKDRTREACIGKALVALDEYMIEGITTNIELHRRILSHPDFRSGNFYTKFLDRVNLFPEENAQCKRNGVAGAA
jgi:acetyl-CoA carboxylase biotin carboxylase subunit